MKTVTSIWFFLIVCLSAYSQHYLRGEIRDEANNAVTNAKIILRSTGYVYYSGNSGGYGIMTSHPVDSLIINLDGFQEKRIKVNSGQFERVVLKMLKSAGNINKNRLISFTKDMKPEASKNWSVSGETYSSLIENQFIPAHKFPETGFAINTDKASYSNIRRFLNMQSTVPPDAVRVEEMLNYFNFGYTSPGGDSIFSFEPRLTSCPWNAASQLMFLKVCAKKVNLSKVPPSNLVFLIDISGSMDMPNRLPLLKSAFQLMVQNLRETDTISIVVYGGAVGVWLQPTSGSEKQKIIQSIEDLYPGGATPGASGIQQAYQLAKNKFIPNGNNRVILATDGDFNIGQTNEEELEKMISQHKQSGIYLTCLGVGMGNYKDSKLEILAKKGNGNFAYLDNESEAQKVLVKELTQTLYTVADDTYMSIRFNPEMVKQYRLIGFDNKRAAVSDSTSELEGGEVGSGHTLMAMFEIIPHIPVQMVNVPNNLGADHFAQVYVNYKCPLDSMHKRTDFRFPLSYTPFEELPRIYQFATSVVMFGEQLKESRFTKAMNWNHIYSLAESSKDINDKLQVEFVALVEKARKIYTKAKKRKGQE